MFMHVIKKVKSYFKVEVSLAYTVSSVREHHLQGFGTLSIGLEGS